MSQKMVYCKTCGQEIAKSARKCPHCGARNKKPFFLRWWFILLAIIVVGVIAHNVRSGGERISWSDIILGNMLPSPPASKGRIYTNSADDLWIDINDVSDKEYNNYIGACERKGFTVEAESNSYSYTAYNADGYKLSLSHYGHDADMSIQLDTPMEMTTITWPAGTAGQQLPTPESTTGKFSYEYDDSFFVYVGNTSKDDYAEYVNACSEKGFNIDYSKGDNYYYADNSEGWHISVSYEGNNIMSIDIDAPYAPDDDDSISDTSVPSTDTPDTETAEPEVAEPETAEEEPDEDTSGNDGLDPDFKAAMDSYENFMDEYVALMKKYEANPDDLSLLADYFDYIDKYADFVEDFENWEDEEMNAAETAYYIDVQARVSKKLLEVAE